MSAMRTTGLVALALVFALAVAAAGSASTKLDSLPTHFAGFPPEGVKASTPTTGRLLIGLRPTDTTTWNVYADGRVIWQKWTSSGDATVIPAWSEKARYGLRPAAAHPQGCATTPVEAPGDRPVRAQPHDSKSAGTTHGSSTGFEEVIDWSPSVECPHPTHRGISTSPTQRRPRRRRSRRSRNSWPIRPVGFRRERGRDRRIRAFVPARYVVAFDRSYPELSKLPAPAAKALVQYKQLKRHGCQIVTTGQARALVQAFVKAGISPSENSGVRLSPSTSPACTSLTPHTSICTLHFQTLAASSPATCPGARPSAPENAPAAATDMAGAAHERPVRVACL